MLGPVSFVAGLVLTGYQSDAQWEESDLISPHCCLSSACPRPCLIHRMNFVHTSQTSPSTWATQGNSSTQVCMWWFIPALRTTVLISPSLPPEFLLQGHQIYCVGVGSDSRVCGPQGTSQQRASGDSNSSNKVSIRLTVCAVLGYVSSSSCLLITLTFQNDFHL